MYGYFLPRFLDSFTEDYPIIFVKLATGHI
jgi:hypothetical protein